MKHRMRDHKGITVLEVVVIGLIIAAALFFLLPQLLEIGSSVEANTCETNLRTISRTYVSQKALHKREATAAKDKIAWLVNSGYVQEQDVQCPGGENPRYVISDVAAGMTISCPIHGEITP